ncbi:ATP-dependent RNA helicase HrpA [Corynebacterium pseudotuberculosis]|uniref:ATP-dependent RNA helicase HrpA n=1 Tax=Corynebacterium pseudotuberculosis TaxID=1719 RepID=UPI00021AAF35|nr:ATP-dependent RNA helicase HrpA [Corynebacterium pseudotuberculosis]AEK92561.1 ATP-dependent RNA helicase hrpA [Corynebacterium pseudotuberculosis PAT10]ARS60915.1 ATP-dependent RNA helicase [Corynebacterium pseudotuberculosis]QGX53445.1 ATP-dependent RNA helicase HrpA [Corynebacterium pseudotuberculosis]QHI75283.1 ATP-dependent RNA helicase HrpA [Corynebacterium pseudotuberculosis]RKT30003.1 ATP-dependent helicase HrpA [Corynebacterium pseudotuberculosis]
MSTAKHQPHNKRDVESKAIPTTPEEQRSLANFSRTDTELRSTKESLRAQLSQVSIAEERVFLRRILKASSKSAITAISADIQQAQIALSQKAALIPSITFPENLPVSSQRDAIAQAITNNQVVIIAGETGSGKTTQIPKICLELGRGVRGLIGHTQPRRLAARTVAERIAEELDQKIGSSVGYAIRFDDRVSASTSIKLMTDGILLAEMQRDRFLNAYDTIIIDEAHERSLNIDFILGYLKQLLPRRPDLKVIITSATIDPERFAQHFANANGEPAPIIEVSGRTYPVEILYRPLEIPDGEKLIDVDPIDGLIQAIQELMGYGPGDILCFFAGEADIREAMDAIEAKRWKNVEVTPLFGRLSNQEQHRVFSPHSGRRIVLATNIAETSLTVPGIHFVVDTGTARISRYSTRTKGQRLPIEPISQASANQRSGRCGRVTDGIAIRLYSQQDFESRPEFTDPEILRTNLASVILRMASLKLGDIENFPFIQAPDTRAIRDGFLLLKELGVLADSAKTNSPLLTTVGRTLAKIPLDPRLARMLIAAEEFGCLREAYIVVAALSIQDVRERPLEKQSQADQLHARFKDTSSDFLSYLKLWEYISEKRTELSGNAFRRTMQSEFLHYMRIREWSDLIRQLRSIGEQIGWTNPDDIAGHLIPDNLHKALLAGLLSHIGLRDGDSKEFIGSRNSRFLVFPGSSLAKRPPQFLMAAELVETSRLWARNVAEIDPAWVEHIGKNLLKHNYSEPYWSTKRVAAMVHQRSTLYGVPIIADRPVGYASIDPRAARDMFIREALVNGNWTTHHKFYRRNAEKLLSAAQIEEKIRRRDVVIDEDALYNFYDSRLPDHITTGRSFDRWWKTAVHKTPHLLDFDLEKLRRGESANVNEEDFLDIWRRGSLEFGLTYHFDPSAEDDGVTVLVPVPLLGGLDADGFEWLVPGLLEDLVTELIRSLPKHLRKTVVPAPDFAHKITTMLNYRDGFLYQRIAECLSELGRPGISADDFNPNTLPKHLKITFAAVDKRGRIIDRDKSLDSLKSRRSEQIRASVSRVSHAVEQSSAKEWTPQSLGTISQEVTTKVDGQLVTTYPALVVTPEGISVKAMPTKREADISMFTATLTLLLKATPVNTQKMLNGLPLQQRVAIENYPHGGATGFVNDAQVAVVRDLIIANGGAVRSPEEFSKLQTIIKPLVPSKVRAIVVELAPGINSYLRVKSEINNWTGPAIDDINNQLNFLLPPRAISQHGAHRLKHLPRYVQAITLRLEDMERMPDRDADRQLLVNRLERGLAQKIQKSGQGKSAHQVRDIQWLIQELRVSLFAQRLGTTQSVSERKIAKAIEQL